jgi:hypothetical protein
MFVFLVEDSLLSRRLLLDGRLDLDLFFVLDFQGPT